jgi:hypothetical protein
VLGRGVEEEEEEEEIVEGSRLVVREGEGEDGSEGRA